MTKQNETGSENDQNRTFQGTESFEQSVPDWSYQPVEHIRYFFCDYRHLLQKVFYFSLPTVYRLEHILSGRSQDRSGIQ